MRGLARALVVTLTGTLVGTFLRVLLLTFLRVFLVTALTPDLGWAARPARRARRSGPAATRPLPQRFQADSVPNLCARLATARRPTGTRNRIRSPAPKPAPGVTDRIASALAPHPVGRADASRRNPCGDGTRARRRCRAAGKPPMRRVQDRLAGSPDATPSSTRLHACDRSRGATPSRECAQRQAPVSALVSKHLAGPTLDRKPIGPGQPTGARLTKRTPEAASSTLLTHASAPISTPRLDRFLRVAESNFPRS